jgi:D-alanyl-D-alanine carboxypeptidase-like protein
LAGAGTFFLEEIMITEPKTELQIPELVLQPPIGLAAILREFGDVREFVTGDGGLDPRWEVESLARVALPFGLLLSWDQTKRVSAFRCHRRLREIFGEVFARIAAAELASKLRSFGGCFMYRPQRTGTKLSTHSWGIAIDLNPETNGLGTLGDMDGEVIKVFQDFGFEWGGEWLGRARDPMHFQFCSEY